MPAFNLVEDEFLIIDPVQKKCLHYQILIKCHYRVLVIYSKTGYWVYPVLEVLNWGQKAGFFASLLLLITALYICGEKMNNLIWCKL
jgi:FAR-17a/AIG1-like protein